MAEPHKNTVPAKVRDLAEIMTDGRGAFNVKEVMMALQQPELLTGWTYLQKLRGAALTEEQVSNYLGYGFKKVSGKPGWFTN